MKFFIQSVKNEYADTKRIIESCSTSYPANYQSVNPKTELVIKNLNIFKGKTVLDLGSNFGMFSFLLAHIADRVIGLEREKLIYQASIKVKDDLTAKGYYLENVEFVNSDVSSHLFDGKCDGILATLILYHLSNHEVDKLQDFITKHCDVALIQLRPGRALKFKNGTLKDFISNNDRYGGLIDVEGGCEFLRKCGFVDISVHSLLDFYYGEDFPILIGQR